MPVDTIVNRSKLVIEAEVTFRHHYTTIVEVTFREDEQLRDKLRGKEREIYDKRRKQGQSEFYLAIEYGVYPNAIRQLVLRFEKQLKEAEAAAK